jgi:hypothetical protein
MRLVFAVLLVSMVVSNAAWAAPSVCEAFPSNWRAERIVVRPTPDRPEFWIDRLTPPSPGGPETRLIYVYGGRDGRSEEPVYVLSSIITAKENLRPLRLSVQISSLLCTVGGQRRETYTNEIPLKFWGYTQIQLFGANGPLAIELTRWMRGKPGNLPSAERLLPRILLLTNVSFSRLSGDRDIADVEWLVFNWPLDPAFIVGQWTP